MERQLDFLAKYRRPLLAAAVALAGVVALIDFNTMAEVDICHLYFASIAGVAWYSSRRTSVAFALGVGVMSVLPHYVHGMPATETMIVYGIIVTSSYVSAALVVNQFAATLGQMDELAHTDALTGIPNSRDFKVALEAEFRRSHRYGSPLTVAFIDVDDFKEINDSRGHHVGDSVLAGIATLISERVRAQDVLGRLGGDEFGLLLPETGAKDARPMLERIGRDVAALARAEGWPVSVSIGASTYGVSPDESANAHDLLQHADHLMYRVKTNGKGYVLLEDFATASVATARP